MAGASVIVTGVGAVSAWGWGSKALWAGLEQCGTAIGPLTRFDPEGYATCVAGEVPPAPPGLFASVPGWARRTYADRFAVAASLEALEQAGLPTDLSSFRVGLFFGTSTAGMFESEGYYARLRGRAPGRPRIGQLASQQLGAPADCVARLLGVGGPVQTVASACASATLAIGAALDSLRAGEVDLALAGGADSLCRITYGGFNALQSVDPRPCRPFRADRAGLSLGEGGAVLVLERAADARRPDAAALAELVGFGSSADAHHMTAPRPDGAGAAQAIRLALDDAGLEPGGIDFLNAHGTGTQLNDRAEWLALQSVLGDRAGRIPVLATKAGVGHTLGAAGALQAAVTALCLRHQRIHPVPGDPTPAPDTPVRLVDRVRQASLRAGVSLNLAFGGCNAALVFSRGSA